MSGCSDIGILSRIVATKKSEVKAARAQDPLDGWKGELADLPPTRDFHKALNRGGQGAIRVIAEIKKASPSKGVIRDDFNPQELARAYTAGGASAISVLTDRDYFMGDLDYLRQVREVTDLPLLRKDFTIDPYQIYEARRYGADAVLLIAAILTDGEMRSFIEHADSVGLAALVEVHTAEELARAAAVGARIIGVNNRNLDTFETDIETTYKLDAGMPEGVIRVSESGISERAQVARLEEAGIDAILVGESLMRQDDVEKALKKLLP
ncbi:MAG: indole-3-glycerol phosphate synthase TrpC [Leptospirillia bacterium]